MTWWSFKFSRPTTLMKTPTIPTWSPPAASVEYGEFPHNDFNRFPWIICSQLSSNMVCVGDSVPPPVWRRRCTARLEGVVPLQLWESRECETEARGAAFLQVRASFRSSGWPVGGAARSACWKESEPAEKGQNYCMHSRSESETWNVKVTVLS